MSIHKWYSSVRLGLLVLAVGGLVAGCGSGSDGSAGAPGATGATGPAGPQGPAGVSAIPAAVMTAAQFQALQPQVTVQSVTISSPPVVKFTVKDQAGNPITGLGLQKQAAGALVKTNYNIQFTLAKLVPGTNGAPSKWVNYLVSNPASAAQTTMPAALAYLGAASYPRSDTAGTLVDNGDGTYQYTFYRNPKDMAAYVAALTDDATHLKADLGDVSYDPTLTHRLGIIIDGAQPGTGTNTPTAVQTATPVPLVFTGNAAYDFRPDGGTITATREVVMQDSCNACHDGKGIGHVSTATATNGVPAGRYVGRHDPRLCVTCHTDQTKYGFVNGTTATNGRFAYYTQDQFAADGTTVVRGGAAFDYPRMIHQTHMGERLTNNQLAKGMKYNLNNHCSEVVGTSANFNVYTNGAQCFDQVAFPQDQGSCTKCHAGAKTASANATVAAFQAKVTADGDNWSTKPSRMACGACHDGINWATGKGTAIGTPGIAIGGHVGGAQTDDSNCATCHRAGFTDIVTSHAFITQTPNHQTLVSGGSAISYTITSVTLNASRQPVIKFKITKNGADVTSLPAAPLVTNAVNGQKVVDPNYEPIPGYAGGPSFYVAFGVPQDGITAPADYNFQTSVALANLLMPAGVSPSKGSITGPDASNVFTATLTGDPLGQPKGAGCVAPVAPATATCVNTALAATPIKVPANATLVTGAMIGTFTQKTVPGFPYTAANVSVNPTTSASGGVVIASVLAKQEVSGMARRVLVAKDKCNACHDQLGTIPNFHGGARNDPTACAFCHNNTQNGNGWASNANTFIHGIHGDSKRTVNYGWHANDLDDNYDTLLYPGLLRDCNQCHVANAVNYTAAASVMPNLMWPTAATSTLTAGDIKNSPYITTGVNYGNGFSYVLEGQTVGTIKDHTGATLPVSGTIAPAGGAFIPADTTTLVHSPVASACFSCHDSAAAVSHFRTMGGYIYAARANTPLVNPALPTEACITCHGAGTQWDAVVIHQ